MNDRGGVDGLTVAVMIVGAVALAALYLLIVAAARFAYQAGWFSL